MANDSSEAVTLDDSLIEHSADTDKPTAVAAIKICRKTSVSRNDYSSQPSGRSPTSHGMPTATTHLSATPSVWLRNHEGSSRLPPRKVSSHVVRAVPLHTAFRMSYRTLRCTNVCPLKWNTPLSRQLSLAHASAEHTLHIFLSIFTAYSSAPSQLFGRRKNIGQIARTGRGTTRKSVGGWLAVRGKNQFPCRHLQ